MQQFKLHNVSLPSTTLHKFHVVAGSCRCLAAAKFYSVSTSQPLPYRSRSQQTRFRAITRRLTSPV